MIRSQALLGTNRPASVSGGSCFAARRRRCCSSRRRGPGVVPVRTTPRMVRLYFTAGIPARERIADHLADVVDLAVALRTLAQHDIGVFGLRDVARTHRQRDHGQRDAMRFNPLAQFLQAVDGAVGRQRAADMRHAERRDHAEHRVLGGVLRPELHRRLSAAPRSRNARGNGRRGCTQEMSAIHCLPSIPNRSPPDELRYLETITPVK